MQIQIDRRALHRIPELDADLPETLRYVRQALSSTRASVFSPCDGALCAFFDFGASSAIAFRCDMDALPVTEQTGASYSSVHPGRMHACGHDGHTAILLELARRLSAAETLNSNVLLVFQPSEETTGGAQSICESGVFEARRVKAIFGLHLWPGLPEGVIASRKNELMSRASELTIDIRGKSSHVARASEGLDALQAGVALYTRVRALERSLPDSVYRLCEFGRMDSGTARNVISSSTHMEGCLRAFQDDVFKRLADGIRGIADDIARETGCAVDVRLSEGYPAVMNPPELFDRAMAAVPFETIAQPVMTTEDFSFYQRRLPGLFFFLGLGSVPALHAADFDFDDALLSRGADFFEQLARRL